MLICNVETLLDLDLTLFDGEGGGDGGGTAGDGLAGALSDGQDTGVQTDTSVVTDTQVDRGAEFEKLIKGDYRDEFNSRMQRVIDQRFKESKTLEGRLGQMQPILDALGSKYGVGVDDLDKLKAAIDQDESYYEAEAERKGLTVEQLKSMKQMEAELTELKRAAEQRQSQEQAAQVYQQWMTEAEQCKQIYPDFDFQREARDPETGERFASLLKNHVDVKTAYEILHKDELLSGAIQYAVQNTQRRTVDNIRARGLRPQENGGSGNASAAIGEDPSKWTKKQRDDISRRVMRGERITLG